MAILLCGAIIIYVARPTQLLSTTSTFLMSHVSISITFGWKIECRAKRNEEKSTFGAKQVNQKG